MWDYQDVGVRVMKNQRWVRLESCNGEIDERMNVSGWEYVRLWEIERLERLEDADIEIRESIERFINRE